MTTAGWPTPRSIPTSVERHAPASSSGRPPFADHGISRIERVMTDNALDDRRSADPGAALTSWVHANVVSDDT
jgi:hypothetical protein